MFLHVQNLRSYVFCYKCNKIYAGHDVYATIDQHPDHANQTGIEFTGVFVLPDFISESEETDLMTGIDSQPWDISQSGRRKQVSINFKLDSLCVSYRKDRFKSFDYKLIFRTMDPKQTSRK